MGEEEQKASLLGRFYIALRAMEARRRVLGDLAVIQGEFAARRWTKRFYGPQFAVWEIETASKWPRVVVVSIRPHPQIADLWSHQVHLIADDNSLYTTTKEGEPTVINVPGYWRRLHAWGYAYEVFIVAWNGDEGYAHQL